jgi:membrane-associated phospholipid phosphatase
VPFCLPDIEPFVPEPPPRMDSAEYAASWSEVRGLGGKTGFVRTAEQSQIAVFWSDFNYTAMPPGHWHLIAGSICEARGTSLPDSARLFALISLAQADAAIVCWEAKFRYNLWRPVTAIQRANEDGNPATEADPSWDSLLAAPPFPSYTSGHSTFSKASANVLARFFGTDAIEFDATSDSLPGVTRHFHSLAACADEVGMSRIYGGIHFSFDNVAGKRCGAAIGDYVSANFLLPNAALPLVRIESTVDGNVLLRLHGTPGRTLRLLASSDLIHWAEAARAVASVGGVTVRDVGMAGSPSRFYRVRAE